MGRRRRLLCIDFLGVNKFAKQEALGRGLGQAIAIAMERGSCVSACKSVNELETAITSFISNHNLTEAKPFTWRADPEKNIAAGNWGFQVLESIH